MEYTPSTYARSTVIGDHVITGEMLGENDEIIGYLPVYLSAHSDPCQAFAATLRVMNHYLNKNNIAYIQEKHLIDSLEDFFEKIQVRLETTQRSNEITIWRSAFDDMITRLRGEMH